ncbi:MAG: hypothetical protein ACR2P1_21970 [Pseudomonadales bacterium]
MKERKLRELSLILLVILGMIALLFGCSGLEEAQAPEAQAVYRTILPLSDPKFKGKIEKRLDASTPDSPEAVKAPEGAPNVLLIMGYRHYRIIQENLVRTSLWFKSSVKLNNILEIN